MTRRLRVLEIPDDAPAVVRATVPLAIGELVEVGREAEVEIGVDDPRMSRLALAVTPHPESWDVRVSNLNGGLIHPWGLPPLPMHRREHQRLAWPLLGVRSARKCGRRSYHGPGTPSWLVQAVGSWPGIGWCGRSARRAPRTSSIRDGDSSSSIRSLHQTWWKRRSCQTVNRLTL